VNDYVSLLPSTLQWVAQLLTGVSPIPWPLWLGGLFPVYVAVVSVLVWMLRGTVWPVRCAYPVTSRGVDCRNTVPGEWHRCRHHNRRVQYVFGHEVREKLQRWQRIGRNGEIVERPATGFGTFSMRPQGGAVLYYNGYTRRPLDVPRIFRSRAVLLWNRLRQARLRDDHTDGGSPTAERPARVAWGGAAQADLAEGLGLVVGATRFSAVAFAVGLVCTVVSIPLDGMGQASAQYLAVLAFVLAWAAVNSGLYKREDDWLREACYKAVKWWLFIFVPVAVINAGFALVN
jgi:hypothetical protein